MKKVGTKIYGASDDLIEFEGDICGEISHYGSDDDPRGVLIICSDGTLLEVKYGKGGRGIWCINVLKPGELFDLIEFCHNEDAEIHSDIVYFKPGMKFMYYATRGWGPVV